MILFQLKHGDKRWVLGQELMAKHSWIAGFDSQHHKTKIKSKKDDENVF